MAGSIVRPTALPAHASSSRGRVRRLEIGGLLAVLLTLVAAVQLMRARSFIQEGADHLRAAEVHVRSADYFTHLQVQLAAQRDVASARDEFGSAQQALWPWSIALRHLGWVPRAGNLMVAGPAVADAGAEGSASILSVMQGARYVLPQLSVHSRAPMLPRLVPGLIRAQRDFRLGRDQSRIALAHVTGLTGSLGSAAADRSLQQLRDGLKALNILTTWLAVAPMLVGASGPTNYLIAWQDPREQRATGGFIGAANFVTVNRGKIYLHPGSASRFVKERHVLLPLPEATYTNEGFFQFCDSNWSPNFPLSARLERWTYGEDTGRWANTVVNVVGATASSLLQATGPIYVPSYHQLVTSRNAEAVAQHYIYSSYRGVFDARHDAQRKRFLGAFLGPFLQRLSHLSAGRLPALAAAFGQVIGRQQMLVYDRRPAVQAAIVGARADGSIRHSAGDYVYIVDDNRSYNKLATYVDERARYVVTVGTDGWLHATLTLTYRVRRSPATLEAAGAYFGLLGSRHDYQDFIRVFVPRGATLERSSGLTLWAPEQAYGLTQLAGRILVPEGQTRSAVFTYRIPTGALDPVPGSAYQLTVQRQPEARLSSVAVTVRGTDGVSIQANGGHTSRQRQLNLSLRTPSTQFSVPLVGFQSTGTPRPVAYSNQDPYIPYGDLKDPRHPF